MGTSPSQDAISSPEPLPLFCGLRAKVGIYSGRMDRVLPHGKSGRADYLGPPANRAARLMSAALGGQVGCWAMLWHVADGCLRRL